MPLLQSLQVSKIYCIILTKFRPAGALEISGYLVCSIGMACWYFESYIDSLANMFTRYSLAPSERHIVRNTDELGDACQLHRSGTSLELQSNGVMRVSSIGATHC